MSETLAYRDASFAGDNELFHVLLNETWRLEKEREVLQRNLFLTKLHSSLYYTSLGSWPANLPEVIFQDILSFLDPLQIMKIRLVSPAFRNVVYSKRMQSKLPALAIDYTRSYYASSPLTYYDSKDMTVKVSDIDHGTLVRAKFLSRLIVKLEYNRHDRDERGAIPVLQRLAQDLGESVTELEIQNLKCTETFTFYDLSDIFGAFQSVTKLKLRSYESPPSSIMPLVTKFRNVTRLELSVDLPPPLTDADRMSFAQFANLPSLRELILDNDGTYYYDYYDNIWLLYGISTLTKLTKLDFQDAMFDYTYNMLVSEAVRTRLHKAFARMIDKLPNLEEIVNLGYTTEAETWQDVTSWFQANSKVKSTSSLKKLSFLCNIHASPEEYSALTTTLIQIFPDLEELTLDDIYVYPCENCGCGLFNRHSELDTDAVLERLATGFAALSEHPSLSKIACVHFEIECVDEKEAFRTKFISELDGIVGKRIKFISLEERFVMLCASYIRSC